MHEEGEEHEAILSKHVCCGNTKFTVKMEMPVALRNYMDLWESLVSFGFHMLIRRTRISIINSMMTRV